MKRVEIRIFLLAILVILTSYVPDSEIKKKSFFFSINEISTTGDKILSEKDLEKKFKYLIGKNLLFFDSVGLTERIKNIDYIDTIKIKKIYPNKLIIEIIEKKPVAIQVKNKNYLYITSGGEFIKFKYNELYEKLPYVFGEGKNFNRIYRILVNNNFPIKKIKSFYHFEIERWDILLKNNKLIRLPSIDYEKSLKHYLSNREKVNFNNFNVFDYRIKNELILK